MKLFLAAALPLFLTAPIAANSFEIDMSATEVRANLGTFALADLQVGETGTIMYPQMCKEASSLLISAVQPIVPNDISEVEIIVTMEPGRQVSLRVGASSVGIDRHGDNAETEAMRDFEKLVLNGIQMPCSIVSEIDRLPIRAINGHERLSEILNR